MELLVTIIFDSGEIRKKSPAETVRLEFDYSERFEYLVSSFLQWLSTSSHSGLRLVLNCTHLDLGVASTC